MANNRKMHLREDKSRMLTHIEVDSNFKISFKEVKIDRSVGGFVFTDGSETSHKLHIIPNNSSEGQIPITTDTGSIFTSSDKLKVNSNSNVIISDYELKQTKQATFSEHVTVEKNLSLAGDLSLSTGSTIWGKTLQELVNKPPVKAAILYEPGSGKAIMNSDTTAASVKTLLEIPKPITGSITPSQVGGTVRIGDSSPNKDKHVISITVPGLSSTSSVAFGTLTVNEDSTFKKNLTVNSGVVVNEDSTFKKNLTVNGNLNIIGSLDTVSKQDLKITDNNIILASGATSANQVDGAGIKFTAVTGSDNSTASITYNHSSKRVNLNLPLHVKGDITTTGTVDGVDIAGLKTTVDNGGYSAALQYNNTASSGNKYRYATGSDKASVLGALNVAEKVSSDLSGTLSIPSRPLTGKTVISDLTLNIRTDAEGRVTAKTASVTTRDLDLNTHFGFDTSNINAKTFTGLNIQNFYRTIAGNQTTLRATGASPSNEVVDWINIARTDFTGQSSFMESEVYIVLSPPAGSSIKSKDCLSLYWLEFKDGSGKYKTSLKRVSKIGDRLNEFRVHTKGGQRVLQVKRKAKDTGNWQWTVGIFVKPSGTGVRNHMVPGNNFQVDNVEGADKFEVNMSSEFISGDFHVDGDIYSKGVMVSISDETLKENIKTIENPIGKVLNLRGVNFNFKHSGKPGVGFIAQEVEKVEPSLVVTDESGLKSVNYSQTVALLTEALKEQQKQIDLLKQKVHA